MLATWCLAQRRTRAREVVAVSHNSGPACAAAEPPSAAPVSVSFRPGLRVSGAGPRTSIPPPFRTRAICNRPRGARDFRVSAERADGPWSRAWSASRPYAWPVRRAYTGAQEELCWSGLAPA
jgi:hypothetical protein